MTSVKSGARDYQFHLNSLWLSAKESLRACTWSCWIWGGLSLLASLLLTVSFVPTIVQDAGLDLSYQFCIDYAVVHHLRFGIDFLGSFGPWGIAYNSIYHPQLMGWTISAQVALGIGMFVGIWTVSRNLNLHPLVAAIWVILVSIWPAMAFDDGRVVAMALLPMLLRRTSHNQRDSAASFAVVAVLALGALCKFSFFTAAVGAVGLLSVEDLLRRRSPKLGIWFVFMIIILWRIAGQGISDFPRYILNSFAFASGYSAAMGEIGPDFFMIPTVIGLSALISTLMLARFWKQDRTAAFIVSLTTAGVLFVCFKEGFVRYDGHELAATTGLTMAAFIIAPVMWVYWYQNAPLPGVIAVRAIICATLIASVWCMDQTFKRFLPLHGLASMLKAEPALVRDRFVTGCRWFWNGNQIFDTEYKNGMNAVQAGYHFPALTGTTDLYGITQTAVIASGMDYLPRPVAPGFQVWSPRLIDMNRRSLLNERAPDNILFMPEAIDNRFNSLEDGALWPYLLTLYTPTELTSSGYLVLRRSPQPRSFTFTPLSTGTYRLGDRITVPNISSGAIWMKIKMKMSLPGKLETLLLRAPEVYLNFKKTGGEPVRKRIIPGMTEDGFILSPVVSDSLGFLSLMVNSSHLSNINECSINVEHARFIKNFFDPKIEVSFERLDTPAVDVHQNPDLASLANLGEMSGTTDFPAGTAMITAPDGKWALFSHPPMHLQLAAPAGATHLHVACGIRPDAWDKTEGVIFTISAMTQDGRTTPLFTKTLQPKTAPADRPVFPTDIPLPPSTMRVLFETRGAVNVFYDWAYWSDVRFQ